MQKNLQFDKSLITSQEKLQDDFPRLIEFQNSNDWNVLNKLAIEITKQIK